MNTKVVVKFTVFKKLDNEGIELVRICESVVEAEDCILDLCYKNIDDYYHYSNSDFANYYFTQTFHLEIQD